MKTMLFGGALAVALMQAATAAGPVRYIDAQGVEVIHDRGAPAAVVPGPAGAPPAPPAAPAQLRIAPADQAARDRDRVAILQQELDAESHAYADTWQRLHAPAPAGAGPDAPAPVAPAPDALARMNAQLLSHQKNIQALQAELRRARVGR